MLNIDLKNLINTYIDNDISFNGVIKEYVNTRSLLFVNKNTPHSVLICKPNVIFSKIDMPSYSGS